MARDRHDDRELSEDFRSQSAHWILVVYANVLTAQIAAGKIPAAKIADTQRVIFNQRLDAVVTAVLAVMVLVLIVEALVQWYRMLSSAGKCARCTKQPYVATQWAPGFLRRRARRRLMADGVKHAHGC